MRDFLDFRDRVRIAMDAGVADVRLSREAKMNALDDDMFEAIIEAGDYLNGITDLRCVVLSGDGSAFCAGLDMATFSALASENGLATTALSPRTHGIVNRPQYAVWLWRQLANEVNLSQATVTSILDRLENKGYVERERSTVDKRKVHVHLTQRGIEILRDAPTPLQEQFARQFNDLQEWEQTMIIASLQRVAYMMDAEHIDASPVLDVGTLDRPLESPSNIESMNRPNSADKLTGRSG